MMHCTYKVKLLFKSLKLKSIWKFAKDSNIAYYSPGGRSGNGLSHLTQRISYCQFSGYLWHQNAHKQVACNAVHSRGLNGVCHC